MTETTGADETNEERPSFADLGIDERVLKALTKVGYETPSPIQAATIPPLLEGRHVVGLAQTGTGKTAAFAVPILSRIDLKQKQPQALVLAPTRELALQVSEAFERYAAHLPGLHVLPVYGGQGYGVQLSALRRGVHVIVGTPGRIMDHLEKGTLDLSELRFLVLDEADEMLKMGFADDVETILADTPAEKHVALFSATMPPAIRRISKKYLTDAVEITVKNTTATAPNIAQRYLLVSYPQKVDALTRILEVENFEGMIVFVRTKNETETLAEKLRARGYSATAINGDIAQNVRERTVNQLKAGKLDILVATDVAARGLDVERISHVVNYDIPTDTESYVHRIGRTGRAGRSGDAISFVTPRERYLLKLIERTTKQPLVQMQLPSVEDVNETRLNRFDDQITSALTQTSRIDRFRDIIKHYVNEHDVPEVDVAAALAVVAQGDTPLLLDPADEKPQRPERPERFDRSRPRRLTAVRAVDPPAVGRSVGAATCRWRRTGSRSASVTRSSRARSSARSPTRAVSAVATSATSTSGMDHSIVELPRDLSTESLSKLSRTRISGKLIALEPDDGSSPPRSLGRLPARATRSRATRSPATDPAPSAGFWSLPAGGPGRGRCLHDLRRSHAAASDQKRAAVRR